MADVGGIVEDAVLSEPQARVMAQELTLRFDQIGNVFFNHSKRQPKNRLCTAIIIVGFCRIVRYNEELVFI